MSYKDMCHKDIPYCPTEDVDGVIRKIDPNRSHLIRVSSEYWAGLTACKKAKCTKTMVSQAKKVRNNCSCRNMSWHLIRFTPLSAGKNQE